MQAQRLDGKTAAATGLAKLRDDLDQFRQTCGVTPTLAVVLVGDDPASQIYVQRKREQCEQVGMRSLDHDLPSHTTHTALLSLISQLNTDPTVHGILVQLPLPTQINAREIITHIAPHKDVDGFHPHNMGALATRHPELRPCTPWGIIQLLEHHGQLKAGMHAVVIGTSNIVGRPMALELLMADCTVTICHRATRNLQQFVSQAELLVVAVGKRGVVDSQWLLPGVVVVDVGIHRDDSGHIHGDLDFASASTRASWITPVPGGVGPMTVLALLQNTLQAARQR